MFALFRRHSRKISVFLTLNILVSLLPPKAAALTSGPSQPETQQFAPAGMDNMVDPFTGDFSYNIPLMDVGGYPINLNYAAGITPDAEASWVGLGWNLNVGSINRSVRGLPDDFSGDDVTKVYDIKPNQTYGVTGNVKFEIFGAKLKNSKFAAKLGVTANLFYNNYNGFGLSLGASPSVNAGVNNKSGLTGSLGINSTLSSESGLEVSPKLGLSSKQEEDGVENTLDAQISFPYSTREGLKGMSLAASYSEHSKTKSSGISRDAFMGFAAPTYMPSSEHDKYNINASLNIDFSPTNPVFENPAFGFGGYYSGQFLKESTKHIPAYGYMYSGASNSSDKLMDFNREKDGGYNKFTTNLAVTNYTYDIFQVSGQGVGGSYRLFRGDLGTVHDPKSKDKGHSPGIGVGVGVGTTPSSKIAVDASYNYTESYSGKWADDRKNINQFKNEREFNNPESEKVYFKKIGDMGSETDDDFLDDVQFGFKPFRHAIESGWPDFDGNLSGNYDVRTTNNYEKEDFAITPFTPNFNYRTERRNRNTSFLPLTAKEAKGTAITPIKDYVQKFEWNDKSTTLFDRLFSADKKGYSYRVLDRIDGNKKEHHISEVRVTDESGSRYVYGIPAYNTHQEEVTFALPGNTSNRESGTITYTPGSDDEPGHKNGHDHYFNKVITPPFAHSYLLTLVLSSDYVDSDNVKGPSDGDLGTYTKFNYSRVHEKFKWRTPMVAPADIQQGKGVASFTEGMRGDEGDDKANYVYGEKEIWYLHSIETRTHVAEFHLKAREDGYGVADKSGVLGSEQLYCIDKIILYSKNDKDNSSGEAIKTVHFEYDYSLCPKTPNSRAAAPDPELYPNHPGKGKLTLKKIWFTYGKSEKGVLNPYKFNYCNQDFSGELTVYDSKLNPDYDARNYDRWGNYKESEDGHPNFEWPYATQNKNNADAFAAVYALSSIQTPTGGTMAVLYEADDYGYVQNRQAMRMFEIVGAYSKNILSTSSSENFFDAVTKYKEYLLVDLKEGFRPTSSELSPDVEFRKKYLNFEMMYYKVFQEVISNQTDILLKPRKEFVQGYAEIDKGGCVLATPNSEGIYQRAYIKLKPVDPIKGKVNLGFSKVNPIVRNGWMYARMHLNRELAGSVDADESGLEQVVTALIAQIKALNELMTGFSLRMSLNQHGHYFDPSKSFVRLNDPDKSKIGGGHRVKAIVMSDNWKAMKSKKEISGTYATKETAFYGQLYDYTKKENSVSISSGVAAWEPMMGAEENPFRLPVFVREKVPLAPSREFYLEEPFGESFFPAPSVGYSKVVVKPLKLTAEDLAIKNFTGNGTGRVEHEFYTAYDFPTITNRTAINPKHLKPNILDKFMKFESRDLVTCTQGYYVELNDMHGKQKAQRVYPETSFDSDQKLIENYSISEVEYTYRLGSNGRLNNQVPYIGSDLIYKEASSEVELGVDIDVVQDERYSITRTIGGGAQFNLKYMQFGIVPILVPTGFPDINNEETRFRSMVTTKVVNKFGILESTSAKDNGSTITTSNLAWDSKTGQVLVTKVSNEFHEPIYSFTYPGHWAYSVMDIASSNEGALISDPANAKVVSILKDGDELSYEKGETQSVLYYDALANKFLRKNGEEEVFAGKAKIIRSGARNMPGTPVGSVVTLNNPILGDGKALAFTKVLNAGVTEFLNQWAAFCNCETEMAEVSTNPFVTGERGNIRPNKSYTYLTGRSQSSLNGNLNIRKDGYFTDFLPFWSPQQNVIIPLRDNALDNSRWQYVTQITNYNSLGMEIENQDALERYSMAQFGYGRRLPVATSNNSRYRETGFDGFEDYGYDKCEDDHLSWRSYENNLTENEAHTGRKSIRVIPGEEVEIKKEIVPCK